MPANPMSPFMQGEEAYSKNPPEQTKNPTQNPTITFVSVELLFNKWRQNFEKNECSVLGEQLLMQLL